MCLGEERTVLHSGQAVYIPSGVFHQLTNIGDAACRMSSAVADRGGRPGKRSPYFTTGKISALGCCWSW